MGTSMETTVTAGGALTRIVIADLDALRAALHEAEGAPTSVRPELGSPLPDLIAGQEDETALWQRCASAFTLDPQQWIAYGNHLLACGRIGEALDAYRALSQKPRWRWHFFRYTARLHQTIEDWPRAILTWTEAMEEFRDTPRFDDILASRGSVYLRAGLLEDACSDYLELRLRQPSSPAGHLGLIRALCAMRAFGAARAVRDDAARLSVHVPPSLDSNALIQMDETLVRASGDVPSLLAFGQMLARNCLDDASAGSHLRRVLHNRSAYFSPDTWNALTLLFTDRPAVATLINELRASQTHTLSEEIAVVEAQLADGSLPAQGPNALRLRAQRATALVRLDRREEALAEVGAIARDTQDWPAVPETLSTVLEWRDVQLGDVAGAQARYWTRRRRLHTADRSHELAPVTRVAEMADVIVLTQVRNEMPNLPSFLDHHRQLGVRRFVIVDNGSEDGTAEYLAAMNDVELLMTRASYRRAGAGVEWLDPIARRPEYADTLCLRLDADERFVYPHCDRATVSDLWTYLRGRGFDGIAGPMIDLFPESLATISSFPDHVEASRYFDADVSRCPTVTPPYREYAGGVRSRSLGGKQQTLGKVPGLRGGGRVERLGSHRCSPVALADLSCALLHYKFRPDFFDRAREEIARREYAQNGQEWQRYLELETRTGEVLPAEASRPYQSWHDLVAVRLMHSSDGWDAFVDALAS